MLDSCISNKEGADTVSVVPSVYQLSVYWRGASVRVGKLPGFTVVFNCLNASNLKSTYWQASGFWS